MELQKTWIRIAGHAAKIKADDPFPWRCYIKGHQNEIALKSWSLEGISNAKNIIPGSKSTRDEHGLVAWIDCFGSFAVKEGILRVNLADPKIPAQN